MFSRTFAFYSTSYVEHSCVLLYIGEKLSYLSNELSDLFFHHFFESAIILSIFLCSLIVTEYIFMVSAQKNKTFEQAQESQINYLKEALIKSSNQLDIQRETLAANFHDETGNLLSVIIHQAIQ